MSEQRQKEDIHMRTERLFYKDSHQTTCQAKVLACREVKKGYEILLDQTVFYPEGVKTNVPAPCSFLKSTIKQALGSNSHSI